MIVVLCNLPPALNMPTGVGDHPSSGAPCTHCAAGGAHLGESIVHLSSYNMVKVLPSDRHLMSRLLPARQCQLGVNSCTVSHATSTKIKISKLRIHEFIDGK